MQCARRLVNLSKQKDYNMQNDNPYILDWANVRPQELENRPLSGTTVNFRSHSGSGVSFRSVEYKSDADGIARNVPIEAIHAMEGVTFRDRFGKPFKHRFDLVDENGVSIPREFSDPFSQTVNSDFAAPKT